MAQTQENAALQAMKEWLAHPQELGKAPARIECTGTFELHGLRYYLFRYKKTLLGSWLLGVCGGYEGDELEHCGHVWSEMEPYDESTAVEKATAMVEMIRAYWMQQAEKADSGGRIPNAPEPLPDLYCSPTRAGTRLLLSGISRRSGASPSRRTRMRKPAMTPLSLRRAR